MWVLPTAASAVGLWMKRGWVRAVACVAGGLPAGRIDLPTLTLSRRSGTVMSPATVQIANGVAPALEPHS